MMQIQCYSCQKKSTIPPKSQAVLRCPQCLSQAVQYVNKNNNNSQNNNNNQRSQNVYQGGHNDRRYGGQGRGRSARDVFQEMENMILMRDGLRGPIFDDLRRYSTRNDIENQYIPQYYANEWPSQYDNPNNYQHIQQPKHKKPNINNYKKQQLSQQCPICHLKQKYKQNKGVELPCGHIFHRQCLQPWFEVKDNCPCCRFKL